MKSLMGFVKSVLSMKKPKNSWKIGSDMKLTIYSVSCMLARGLEPHFFFLLTACKHVKTILKSARALLNESIKGTSTSIMFDYLKYEEELKWRI